MPDKKKNVPGMFYLCSILRLLITACPKLMHNMISETTQWYLLFCKEHCQWMSSILFHKNESRWKNTQIILTYLVSCSFFLKDSTSTGTGEIRPVLLKVGYANSFLLCHPVYQVASHMSNLSCVTIAIWSN